ncbi:hypothetical protein [Methylobacterium marchantiae]|uniref:Uncharacterized protein n=1 Tax=Methylobacterium marchantiae TaxID=600331 RepID=A0ABW3X2B3_9HYPH
MRSAQRLGPIALALAGAFSASAASAQYYDDGYDRPPPRRYYDDRGPPPPRRAVGLNCDAVQSGITGPQPYSCPLPGPRPLGVRCFCDLPLAPLSPAQTAVGRVVP